VKVFPLAFDSVRHSLTAGVALAFGTVALSADVFTLDDGYPDKGPAPHSVLELTQGPNNPRNSEGAFLLCGDGRILFAYSRYSGTCKVIPSFFTDDEAPCVIACRTSRDKGETWSGDEVLARHDRADGNVMSPSFLRLDARNVLLFYLRKDVSADRTSLRKVLCLRSHDDGLTWDPPRECPAVENAGCNVLNNDRAVRLKTGRILLPIARHTCVKGNFDAAASLFCLYSDDAGETWRETKAFFAYDGDKKVVTQEPGLVELLDGRVLMFARTDTGRQWYAYSSDGGISWGKPFASDIHSPCSPATIKRLSNGELMMIFNDHEGRNLLAQAQVRAPLSVAISTDEGRTWARRRLLENKVYGEFYARYWYCYTGMLELEDRILLSYVSGWGLATSRITSVPKAWLP